MGTQTPITVRNVETNETWETTLEQFIADNRDEPPEITIADWFAFNQHRPVLLEFLEITWIRETP